MPYVTSPVPGKSFPTNHGRSVSKPRLGILRELRSGSPGYHVRAGCCSKHRSRRRHRVQRDRLLHVDAPFLRTPLDPRREVIDSTANKYTAPQRQLSGIYNHAEDIHTRLKHLMDILLVSRFLFFHYQDECTYRQTREKTSLRQRQFQRI